MEDVLEFGVSYFNRVKVGRAVEGAGVKVQI